MDAAIDAAFSKPWMVGGVERLCRYRFKDGVHTIKTTSAEPDILAKSTICVNPDGREFEVINSKQVLATTFEHTLQVLNQIPAQNWTPKR